MSSYPTEPEPWSARCAPHIIISSSLVDVLQVRKSSVLLTVVEQVSLMTRLDGDTATGGGRVPDH